MVDRLLDLDGYSFHLLAVQTLVTSAIVAFLGFLTLVIERASRISLVFVAITCSVALWLFSCSFLYSSPDPQIAMLWNRMAHVGIIPISATCYHFSVRIQDNAHRFRVQVIVFWALTLVFMALAVGTDVLYSSLNHFSWGYYPAYGMGSIPFLVFFLTVAFLTVRRLWLGYRAAARSGANLVRPIILVVAFATGYSGTLDFVPTFGIDWYPFGFMPILVFILLCTYVVVQFRFVAITPAFAAHQIVAIMNEALLVLDRQLVIKLVNPAACRLFGASEAALIGQRADHTLLDAPPFREDLDSFVRHSNLRNYEVEYCRGKDTTRTLSISSAVMRGLDGEPQAIVCVAQDITDRRESEERIRFLAYYDGLTHLPNRTFCTEQLSRALEQSTRYERGTAIMFIDLDNFKRINDTLGHENGDLLLKAVAERIRQCVRNSDYVSRPGEETVPNVVSRLGGDEFIIMLTEIRSPDDTVGVARRVLEALARPYQLARTEIIVTASIGIAVSPMDGNDTETILRNADAAMYHAKMQGKNNYQFYAESMNASVRQRLQLELQLRKAIGRNEFVMYYQPLLDVRSERLVGCEALIRWNHPERGQVLPIEFVPFAEETGIIIPIGTWVIQAVCAQQRAWLDSGIDPLRVAINLSSRQVEKADLVDTITSSLRDYNLDPCNLELEITESAIMRNPDKAAAVLGELKAMGIRICIDDFGTGYSSLGYLRRLPVDVLKIDHSLIANTMVNPEDAAIASAIIAMAHSLHLRVVAEGVTSEPELQFLRTLSCDEVQGFYFSRPLPAQAFAAFQAEHR